MVLEDEQPIKMINQMKSSPRLLDKKNHRACEKDGTCVCHF